MARVAHLEGRRGSHALPADARSSSDPSTPSYSESTSRSEDGSRSSLYSLAEQAKNRRATRQSQDLLDTESRSESSSGSYTSDNYGRTPRVYHRTESMSSDSVLSVAPSNAEILSRRPSLDVVEPALDSGMFSRKGSTPFGISYDSTPGTGTSWQNFGEEVRVNGEETDKIERMGLELEVSAVSAHVNETIANAILAYYVGNGSHMIGDLTRATSIASNLEIWHLAARAQLWKAMLLHQIGQTDNMAMVLADVLDILASNPLCEESDFYQTRKLLYIYGGAVFMHMTDSHRAKSATNAESLDLHKFREWLGDIMRMLDARIDPDFWPSAAESLAWLNEAAESNYKLSAGVSRGRKELQARLLDAENKNEQLEADLARYRAERQVYSNLSTPATTQPRNSQSGSARGSADSWLFGFSNRGSAARLESGRSGLDLKNLDQDLPQDSYSIARRSSAPVSRRSYSFGSRKSSVGSSWTGSESGRHPGPLIVRNRTPSTSKKGSPGSRRSSSSRQQRSRQSLNWRADSIDRPHSTRLKTQSRDAYPIGQPMISVLEGFGSGLKNMISIDAQMTDEAEVSPKNVSHRKPSLTTRTPGSEDAISLAEWMRRNDLKDEAAMKKTTKEFDNTTHQAPSTTLHGHFRRRSGSTDPNAVLQIEEEEYEMTGAKSPVELSKQFPRLFDHKEKERRNSTPSANSPESTHYPSYEELRQRLMHPKLEKRRRPVESEGKDDSDPSLELLKPRVFSESTTKSPVPYTLPKTKVDYDFDFTAVQQPVQKPRNRKLFLASSTDSESCRPSRSIAPLTPHSKSPPSSAISFAAPLSNRSASSDSAQSSNTSPSSSTFSSKRQSSEITPGKSQAPGIDESPTAPPRRGFVLPELLPLHTSSEGSSKKSPEKSDSDSHESNRISWLLEILEREKYEREQRPFVSHTRKTSVPTIPSPLRASFKPEPGEEDIAPINPSLDPDSRFGEDTEYAGRPTDMPGDIRSRAAETGHQQRQNSIYDSIENDYPSPVHTGPREFNDSDIPGPDGVLRRLREEDAGYETGVDLTRRRARSTNFRSSSATLEQHANSDIFF